MITVLDIGKTNAKCVMFDRFGQTVTETRSHQQWIEQGKLQVLNETHLTDWISRSLQYMPSEHERRNLIITTHGLTVGYTSRDGTSVLPILDYEFEIPRRWANLFKAEIPTFEETFCPMLPLSFNIGAQIDFFEKTQPNQFSKVEHVLGYPQYLAWKLTGRAVSERTYISHLSHCWAPLKNDFSSLVINRGWRHLFPEFSIAGEFLGEIRNIGSKSIPRHFLYNGMHDSSAALLFYKHLGYKEFTLISTGTWVVIFDLLYPLTSLDPEKDMLASVTSWGETIATLRFMGGRDYDLLSDNSRLQIAPGDITSIIEKGTYALPGLTEGGQFPHSNAEILGPQPTNKREKAALATLYLACMTLNGLETIDCQKTIIVDGGMCRNKAFLGLLSALLFDKRLFANADAEGTALGAACAVRDELQPFEPSDPCEHVEPWNLNGLSEYFRVWKRYARAANGEN